MSEDVTPKLGQLLKELNHPVKAGLSGEEKSSQVATYAYNPGYPADEIDVPGADPESRDVEINLDKKTDFSMSARQALTDYAGEYLKQRGNHYRPDDATRREPSGHGRAETLERSTPSTLEFTDEDETPTGYSQYFLSNDDIKEKIIDKGVNSADDSILEIVRKLLPDAETTFGIKSKADQAHSSASDSQATKLGVQQVLEAYNRYTPGPSTPFVQTDSGRHGPGDKQLTKGLYTIPAGLLGKRSPLNAKGVTVADLRKAALELLHRAQSISADEASSLAKEMLAANSPFVSTSDDVAANWHKTQAGVGTVGIEGLRIRAMKSMADFPTAFGADDLLSVESFSTAYGGGGTPDEITEQVPRNASSYGTLNSPAEPFNGVAPFGMLIPTIYAILAFGLASILLGALTSGFGLAANSFTALSAEKPYSLAFGLNADRGTNWAGAEIAHKFLIMFGIPKDWGMEIFSMFRGVMLFYGIDINPFQPGAAIADAVLNILLAPGYYALVSKRVLQDMEQITRAFDNYSNFTNSVTGAITILLASIEAFFSSFFIKFFLIMNTIGRIDEDGRVRPGLKAHGQSVLPIRDEVKTRMPLFPSTRPFMSRFYPPTGEPMSPLSAYLFPSLFKQHADTLGPDSLGFDASKFNTLAKEQLTKGPRLSITDVANVEKYLDGEYMPFSIHDLRTNEVVALPAFIESLNDDFTANYNSTHGFGRTDPVHIYTNTTRQISMTFTLVAMNPKDHEYIWFLVNKFVSMVYPQRGPGKKRSFKDENVASKEIKFIQPFSQTIVASPVVRIRVGDTIHSNASTSAFAKIFGGSETIGAAADAGDEETRKKGSAAIAAREALRPLVRYHEINKKGGFLDKFSKGEKVEDLPFVIKKGCEVAVNVDPGAKKGKFIKFKTGYDIYIEGAAEVAEKKTPWLQKEYYIYKAPFEIADEIDAMALGGVPLLGTFREVKGGLPIPPPPFGPPKEVDIFFESRDVEQYVELRLGNAKEVELIKALDDAGCDAIAETKFPTPEGEISTEDKAALDKSRKDHAEISKEKVALIPDLPPDEASEVVSKFLMGVPGAEVAADQEPNPPKFQNPVVKAFDSTRGRGLAGVITQLGLDYFDQLWGTTFDDGGLENALRAPKAVRITLSFNPIHDMPLGLNHKGEMFAPSHPVGMLSKKKLDRKYDIRTEKQKYDEIKEKARAGVGYLPETDNPAKPKLPF